MKSKLFFRLILAALFFAVTQKSNAQAPDWLWAKALGGLVSQGQGKSLAVDSATGDVYISGYFSGKFDFDPGPGTFNLPSIGDEDIFISKFNSLSQLVWVKTIGGTAHDEGKSIVVDPGTGDIYAMGYFSGTVDFDPGMDEFNLISAGSQAVFICKLDNAGNFVWAKAIGETVQTYGDHSITVNPSSGDVYITGSFTSTVDFDPGEGTFNLTSDGNGDMFISKLNNSGDFGWAIVMDGTESSKGNAIAVDPVSGFIYTTGDFKEIFDFDHILISKLDSSGNVIWAKKIRGGQYSSAIAIVFDPSGSGAVYTSGVFNGTVDFDPGAAVFNLTSTENSDVFISKLTSSGDFIWVKQMGGPEYYDYISITSMAIDPVGSGAIITSGRFTNTVEFGPGQDSMILSGSSNAHIYFSKLDSSGNFVWAKQIVGPSSADFIISIDVDQGGSGAIYSTGYGFGDVDFDPGPGTFNLTLDANRDIFISKLSSIGDFIWAETMSTSTGSAGLNSIAIDPAENEDIYTTGSFSGTVDFYLGPDTFNITASRGQGMYVSKSDNKGRFLWAKSIDGTGYLNVSLIVVDPGSGDVYITGNFVGTIDFDPGPDTFNLNSPFSYSFYTEGDIFISKLDADGNFKWVKRIGVGGYTNVTKVTSIAVDPSGNGNVYTIGEFYGTVDFDPGPDTFNLISDSNRSMFISKLDSSGKFVWAKVIGGTGEINSYSLALDPENGAIYTTGQFRYTVDFDPGLDTFNLTSGGYSSMFISKLNKSGDFIWALSEEGDNISWGQSIAIDAAGSGDIYVTGCFDGTFFDLTSAGLEDIFISRLDSSGQFKWTKGIGGIGSDRLWSLVVDPAGNEGVYAAGQFNKTADFDPGSAIFNLISNTGEDEMFISKLDGSGNFDWAKEMDGNNGNGPYPIALDHAGHLYVTGSFQTPSISFGSTTLYNEDNSGKTSDIFIAKLDTTLTTSVTEVKQYPINIYPNPTTNELTFEFEGEDFQKAVIIIYDILGEVVYSGSEQYAFHKKTIDISTLTPGIYFVHTNIDGESVMKKIVKE